MEDVTEAPRNATPRNPAASPGYAALHDSAAVVDRPAAILRLSGKDPRGMLNAILTSDVPEGESTGSYALLLDAKGRIQTDLRVLKDDGDALLVLTEPEGAEAARAILGRYAPFSRVGVEPLPHLAVLGLYGPDAGGLIGAPQLAEHETARLSIADTPLLAAGVALPVGGYDLLVPAERVPEIRAYLTGGGAVPADSGAFETARVEAVVPRFGADLTPENFPGESGVLARAVDFRKGCYPGQETVARMHYRGSPNKSLRLFRVDGPTPEPGEEVLQGEKRVGRVTSVAPLAPRGETLALAYLSRGADPAGPLRAGEAALVPNPA